MDAALWIVILGLAVFSIFTRLHVMRLDRRVDRLMAEIRELNLGSNI